MKGGRAGATSTGALHLQRYFAHRAPSVPRLGLEDGEKGLTNQDCKVELQVRRQSSMVCQVFNQYLCHSSFVSALCKLRAGPTCARQLGCRSG